MDKRAWKRVRGLRKLIHEGVDIGTTFVEEQHRHAVELPLDLLESIQPLAEPVRVARAVHSGILAVTYGSIRAVNKAVDVFDEAVVDVLDDGDDAHEQ